MSVSIRSLQHFLYCPRRWGLIETDRQWTENFFIVRANLAHDKVHSGEHGFSSKNKYVCSNVQIFNDEYNLFGVADCLEFIKCPEKNGGVYIPFLKDFYKVTIVEYKPTPPKKGVCDDTEIRSEDALQVFAQKVCVDSVFQCDSECYLYYTSTRKRVKIPFENNGFREGNEKLLRDILGKIEKYSAEKRIPPAIKTEKCSGCSFRESCMPQVKSINVRKMIEERE